MKNLILEKFKNYCFVFTKTKNSQSQIIVKYNRDGFEQINLFHVHSKIGQIFPIKISENFKLDDVNILCTNPDISYCIRHSNLNSIFQWQIYERLRRIYQKYAKPKFGNIIKVANTRQSDSNTNFFSDLSIILPTKNNPHFIKRLAEDNFFYLLKNGAQVVIVDHNSTSPELKPIYDELSKNGAIITSYLGSFNYSKMINLGAKLCRNPIIWTLNDDVVIQDNHDIHKLIREIKLDINLILSPRLLYEDKSIQHAGILTGQSGICGHIGRHLSESQANQLDIFKANQVWPAVTGAAMMFHKNLFDRLNGFDENLAVEYNDVDFCLRAKQFDAKCAVMNDIKMLHLELATRGDPMKGPNALTIISDRNIFLTKWQKYLFSFDTFTANIDRNTEKIVSRFPPF